MLGIVDVGGGMRGAYGAGVLDACMEKGVRFDCCIGVSAGSANLSSYIAGQKGRNFRFYTEFAFRPEYMGVGKLLRTGSYLNLDYIYGTLSNSNGEYPLDYAAIAASDQRFVIVATDAVTGQAVYFTKDDMKQDDYAPIKASSCVPIADRPYPVGDGLYFDGGISDPVPFERAFQEGCDRVVVILTRPRDFRRVPDRDCRMAKLLRVKYPQAARRLAERAQTYNDQVDAALRCESEGRVLVVAPKTIYNLDTLTKDRASIEKLYRDGAEDARRIFDYLG